MRKIKVFKVIYFVKQLNIQNKKIEIYNVSDEITQTYTHPHHAKYFHHCQVISIPCLHELTTAELDCHNGRQT